MTAWIKPANRHFPCDANSFHKPSEPKSHEMVVKLFARSRWRSILYFGLACRASFTQTRPNNTCGVFYREQIANIRVCHFPRNEKLDDLSQVIWIAGTGCFSDLEPDTCTFSTPRRLRRGTNAEARQNHQKLDHYTCSTEYTTGGYGSTNT